MKMIKTLLLMIAIGSFAGCSKEKSDENGNNTMTIKFQLIANGEPLKTGVDYFNGSGEHYSVSTFKFYISQVALANTVTSAGTSEAESYHLVDLNTPTSQELKVPLKAGKYNQLVFSVGVDSLRNVSGAQTGALDPANALFWTWNSGYIFAKLEGKSPASPATAQSFVYHIGGFRTGANAIRTVTLSFPGNQIVVLGGGKSTEIIIDVNLDQWFDGFHQLSIATTPTIMTPGGESLHIADNYATMFSVNSLITQ
jgi:hypothetical protein